MKPFTDPDRFHVGERFSDTLETAVLGALAVCVVLSILAWGMQA